MKCFLGCKRIWTAAAAVAAAFIVMEYFLHGVLLKGIYLRTHYEMLWNSGDVMRNRSLFLLLGYVLFGFVFADIYAYGYEEGKPPLGQGLRYGFLAGLMVAGFSSLSYAVFPISWKLAGAWAAGGIAECIIAGIATAILYKPADSVQRRPK